MERWWTIVWVDRSAGRSAYGNPEVRELPNGRGTIESRWALRTVRVCAPNRRLACRYAGLPEDWVGSMIYEGARDPGTGMVRRSREESRYVGPRERHPENWELTGRHLIARMR